MRHLTSRLTWFIVVLVLLGSLLQAPAGHAAGIPVPSWIRQFGTPGDEWGYGIAIDSAGNSYVAGATYGTFPGQTNSGHQDAFVRKYDSSGTEVWTRQFGSSADDEALGVVVDGAGNSYVVGVTYGTLPDQTSPGGRDVFLRKYDSSGTEVWTRQFGSTADDYAQGVAVDGAGNSYVAGGTYGTFPGQTSSGGEDAFVRKYDSSGTEVWMHQFGSSDSDWANGVAVDGAGNSYVAGAANGTLPAQSSSGSQDAFLRKYDSSGTEVWTRQFGSTQWDNALDVAVDGAGNSYVAGVTFGSLPGQTSPGGGDAFLRKYDSSGTVMWTRQFGSSSSDDALDVAIDSGGNSYVVGRTWGTLPDQTSSGNTDGYIRKYDSSGTVVWTRQFGTTQWDEAYGVAVDGADKSSVVGFTEGTFPGQTRSGGQDAFLITFEELTVTATVTLPLATRQAPSGW